MQLTLKRRTQNQWHVVRPRLSCLWASELAHARHERTAYIDPEDGEVYVIHDPGDPDIYRPSICKRCLFQALSIARSRYHHAQNQF